MGTPIWILYVPMLFCSTTVLSITTRKAKHLASNTGKVNDWCITECAIKLLDFNFIGSRAESDLQNPYSCKCEGVADFPSYSSDAVAVLLKHKGETVFQPPEIADLNSSIVLQSLSAFMTLHEVNITLHVTSNQSKYQRFNIEEKLLNLEPWLKEYSFDLSTGTAQIRSTFESQTFPAPIDLDTRQTISFSRKYLEELKIFIDGVKMTDNLMGAATLADVLVVSVKQKGLKVIVHALSFETFPDQ